MKFRFLLTYLTSLPLLIGASGQAQESKEINGWNKATWGMTPNELMVLFQKNGIKESRKCVYNVKIGGCEYSKLGIDSFEILGALFETTFLMDSSTNKLKTVQLHLKKDPKGRAYGVVHNLCKKSLLEKYGKPSYDNDSQKNIETFGVTTISTTSESSWNLGSTNVHLEYIHMKVIGSTGQPTEQLKINYSQKHKPDEGL